MTSKTPSPIAVEASQPRAASPEAAAQGDIPQLTHSVEDSAAAATTVEGVSQDGQSGTQKSVKLCGVCEKNEGRYKCTRCLLPYCSIPCSTLHKSTHPALPPPSSLPPRPASPPSNRRVPQPGTVSFSQRPANPFAPLETSTELLSLFKTYPTLTAQLEAIHEATLRPLDDDERHSTLNQKNGRSGNGRGGRDKRGGGRGGGKDFAMRGRPQDWTQDKGLERGVKALESARQREGREGEAVREFQRIVLGILEREKGGGDEEENKQSLEDLLRREIEDENRRVVEALLERER